MNKSIPAKWKRQNAEQALKLDKRQVANFWATRQEVKQKLEDIYEEEERKAILSLAEEGDRPSQSSRKFLNLNLDGGEVKRILSHMANDRKLQTRSGNLVRGTRFENAKKGQIRHTICPNCKENLDT